MLGIEHHFVDPLSRPPFSLAIIAAAIKYISTIIVLEDPVLMTRSDFIRRRSETGESVEYRKKILLGARIIFCCLAFSTAVSDVVTLIHGFPLVHGWQRCHLIAMVLAFSPNAVAAVAALGVTEVKVHWLDHMPVSSDSLGWTCDVVAIMYANIMGLIYILPCFLVFLVYGLIGFFVTFYCFGRDFVTLPWSIHDHHLQAVWIAIPIFGALMMRTLVNIGLVIGQEKFVQWRYPEMTAKISEGDRVSMMEVKMPEQVSARVIGYARNLKNSLQDGYEYALDGKEAEDASCHVEEPLVDLCDGQAGSFEAEDASRRAASRAAQSNPALHFNIRDLFPRKVGGNQDADRSILNDHVLAWLCYAKTTACISLPILQLFVIIAARVYLGHSPWEAGIETFKERSWGHYFGHVWSEGHRGWLRLLWTYL